MLILVRHGRTPANAAGLLQGRLDQDLDEVGVEQAAGVAAYLGSVVGSIDHIISSPLRRAQQTAAVLGDTVQIDERWIELAYGSFEGMPQSEVPGDVWTRWRADPAFAPEGGESLITLDRRVRAACEEVSERSRVENVVVVTHVSPIKSAVAWALGVDLSISWRTHLSQAAICRIDIRPNGPVLMSFNESAG